MYLSKLILLSLSLLVLHGAAVCQLVLSGETTVGFTSIKEQLLYKKDTVGLSFKDLNTALFSEYSGETLLSNRDISYWFCLTIINKADKKQNYVLHTGNNDTIKAVIVHANGETEVQRAGLLTPLSKKKIKSGKAGNIKLNIAVNEELAVFIKMQNIRTKNLKTNFYLEKFERFEKTTKQNSFVNSFVIGLITTVALFTLIFYLIGKRKTALWYSAYLFSKLLFFLFFSGYAFEMFFRDIVIEDGYILTFNQLFGSFFYIMFARELVQTKKRYPRLDKILLYVLGIKIIWTLGIFIIYEFIENENLLILLNSIFYLLDIVFTLYIIRAIFKNRSKADGFFIMGLIALSIASSLAIIADNMGLRQAFFVYGAGVLTELVLLSISMAYRLKPIFIPTKTEAEKLNKRQPGANTQKPEKKKMPAFSINKNNKNNQMIYEELWEQIKKLFEEDECFTNPDLKIVDLAEILGTNQNYVSKAVNKVGGQKFTDLLKEYRVRKAIQIIEKPENSNLPNKALQEQCGFKSHSSFYAAFQDITKMTPKAYREKIK